MGDVDLRHWGTRFEKGSEGGPQEGMIDESVPFPSPFLAASLRRLCAASLKALLAALANDNHNLDSTYRVYNYEVTSITEFS